MEKKKTKQKSQGQVFTPDYLVCEMLDYCSYNGASVLKKHIIDNSCGDGAFVVEVLKRYCKAANEAGLTAEETKRDIETYIHGIDNDKTVYDACIKNLDKTAKSLGITDVKWDIYNENSLFVTKFDGNMDFVVGNPPYIRVHNLDDSYDLVKQFQFAESGMTDLYLAFFELGFRMMSPTGVMCYITPSSWMNSLAASNMRTRIMNRKNLVSLTDLGHFQPFKKITSYTIISLFDNSKDIGEFDYYTFNGSKHNREFVERLSLEDCYIDKCFYLSEKRHLDRLRKIKTATPQNQVSVKNGFATLADKVFIGDSVPESKMTIRVLKASTGKWYKCLYPYDSNGSALSEETVMSDSKIAAYLSKNKKKLLKGKKDSPNWYCFGRSQALKDVSKDKLAINCLLKTEKDIKTELVKAGEGLYSGLYIVPNTDVSFDEINSVLKTQDFVAYVKLLKKYKSGGYYTYNTKDVEQYINHCLTIKTK